MNDIQDVPEHPGLSAQDLREIDRVCIEFERPWQHGHTPEPAPYMDRVEPRLRPALEQELIRVELEWRFRRGEAPSPEEYCRRFPAHAERLPRWLDEAREAAGLPRTLGAYELLRPLGVGGMGRIYEGRHRRLGKRVAVKVLRPGRGSREALERFQREMEAVGPLDHPHLVEAHDAGEEGGELYLVLKYIEGMDLQELVRRIGSLPWEWACELVRQAAEGLQHLHECGLVHRDVKPGNLMLANAPGELAPRVGAGTVKVLDLGLARWQIPAGPEVLTRTGQCLGTPDFLAPEQAADTTRADIRADLYGLGGTLFYLLTGRAPFDHHEERSAKLRAHAGEEPPDVRSLRPEVPAEVAGVVARLLAKDPAHRHATPRELAEELGRLVGRVPGCGGGEVVSGTRPAPTLRICGLEVGHWKKVHGGHRPEDLLGQGSFTTHEGDGVTVAAELSEPAYCYLIAFRPDGVEEVCFPQMDDVPPARTDRPGYPADGLEHFYGLTDGAGLQAFFLVASRKPLPAFAEWQKVRSPSPWTPTEALPDVVLRYGERGLEGFAAGDPQGRTRGKGEPRQGADRMMARLAGWLKDAPDVEAVSGIGFAVQPGEQGVVP